MSKLKKGLIDYIFFAIVALGCFLVFLEFNIGNVFSCMAYIACGIIVYLISTEIGMGEEKSKLCAYAFLTMPIGFFCQFIFGQSEVFMLFFVLLGFYFWLKENNRFFVIAFAIAFLLGAKSFPIFIVLVLLRQKKFVEIIVSMLGFFIPSAIKIIVCLFDPIYRKSFLDFSKVDVIGSSIPLGGAAVNITVMAVLMVAVYSHIKTIESKDEGIKWALYLICLQMFAMFGMGSWEPQYLLLMVPFFTIGAFIHKDTGIFMALDLMLMLCFVLFVVNAFGGVADETLLVNGIFSNKLDGHMIGKLQIKDVLVFQDKGMALSLFSVLLLIMAVFKHPKYSADNFNADVVKGTIGFVRIRFVGGLAIFLVPILICFVATVRPPYITLYTPEISANVGQMISNRQQSEVFIATKGKLENISFCIGTYDRDNDVEVTVRIVDASTEEILFKEEFNAFYYDDCDWVEIDTVGVQLVPGGIYRLDIVCYEADDSNCITVYRTKDLDEQTNGYAFIDGTRQEYHLCVKIMEDYLSTEEAK